MLFAVTIKIDSFSLIMIKFHLSLDPKIFCPVVLEFWSGGGGQRKTEEQSEPENQTLFQPQQGSPLSHCHQTLFQAE